MPTANIMPVYYRVTWNGAAPTNYNELTLNRSGGVDNCLSERYVRITRAVGTQANPTVANLDTIKINGTSIQFTSGGGLNLTGIINTINAAQTETKVVATESPATYLTLLNASGWEGYPFVLEDETSGVLSTKLGLTPTTYETGLFQQGGAVTLPLTNLDNVKINGVMITFVTGALDLSGVVTTINASTIQTGVRAVAAASGMALISVNGQPFTLSAGSTVGTWSNLGFTVGNKGGSVVAGVDNVTLAQSLEKERATMRWDAVVWELGWLMSPIFLGEIVKTGDLNGTAPITTLSFTVGYDRVHYLSTEDELNPGTQLSGAACIRRLVARALVNTYQGKQEIFDPTLTAVGNTCVRVNPLQILGVTAEALDAVADLNVVEANITVTQIAHI
jgi:hypothetical protein